MSLTTEQVNELLEEMQCSARLNRIHKNNEIMNERAGAIEYCISLITQKLAETQEHKNVNQ